MAGKAEVVMLIRRGKKCWRTERKILSSARCPPSSPSQAVTFSYWWVPCILCKFCVCNKFLIFLLWRDQNLIPSVSLLTVSKRPWEQGWVRLLNEGLIPAGFSNYNVHINITLTQVRTRRIYFESIFVTLVSCFTFFWVRLVINDLYVLSRIV